MKCIFTLLIALFCCSTSASSQFKLVVNEFSQGPGGTNKEYIELLVVGIRTCKDSTADIRNWVFDDNNGWYGGNGTGIATGHYRFANNANWAAVPYGSIILLYNNADKNNKITQPNDPADANKDYVYIVPINNALIEENNATPVSPSSIGFTYPTTGYTASGSTWTTIIGLANSGDAIVIVDPANLGVAHFSIAYGGVPAAGFLTPTVTVPLAVNAANNCYLTDNQYNVASSWAEGNVPTNETPGLGNTAANIAWINSMRVQVPPPNLVITNPGAVCSPGTVNLTAASVTAGSAPASMVFTYYSDAAATTPYATPAAATGGTYYIVGTIPGGCADTLPVTATVSSSISPITSFNYSPNTVCQDGTDPTLNTAAGFTVGGIFSALPAGLIIDANTGAINVAASAAGNYTIKYSVPASSCNPAASGTTSFTVNPSVTPETQFSYSAISVCVGDPDPVLIPAPGFNTTGTFTVLPAGLSINAGTGAINVAASAPGSYTIIYSVAASGCNPVSNNANPFTINSVTPAITGFSYSPAAVCVNGADPSLNTVAGFGAGGTYTALPAGLSLDLYTGAINVAASLAGNYTITYSVPSNGCNVASSSTAPFSINTAGAAVTGFTYSPAAVCANATNPTINKVAGFTSGGTYSALPAGLSINANTGAINVAASLAGNYTITYSVPASACTTAGTSTSPFTITAAVNPVTGFTYSPTAVCVNGANPALNTVAGFTPGGAFTSLPAGLSINAGTGAINVAASSAGNYTISYTVAASGCNPPATNTAPFSINAPGTTVTGFSYAPATVCANAANPAINAAAGFTNGGTYTALPAGLSINAGTGAINVAASAPGNYTITYAVAASGCNAAASSTSPFTITAAVNPVTGFNYSPNTVCANGTNPTVNTNAGFTTGGNYAASPAGLSINANTGAINVAASTAGNYTITYSVAASGCNPAASSTSPFTITAAVNPVTGFNYSPTTVCANGTNPTVNTNAGFTTGGTYAASPAGLSINANTGAINVAASTAGNYTITYSVAASGCNPAASSTSPFTITAAVNPVTGFNYSPTTVCANGANPTVNTNAGFTTGGTYTASPAGLSINANTGAINVATSTAGNYTVTYSVAASGCNPAASNTASFTITSVVNPVTGFNYSPSTVCANGTNPTVNTNAGFTTGGIYTASPAGLNINANTGAINVAASTAGNYTVTYSVAASGCNPAASNTASFTITAIVTPVTGFNYSPATVCTNGTNPALNTNAGFTTGGTYTASPAGLSINANTGAINVAASTAGNYTVTYSVAASGCNPAASNTASFTITAIVTPVTGFNYSPTAVCVNGNNPALNTIAGFTTGGTYTALPAGLSINTNTGAINVAASSTGNYTITYSLAANGCNPAASGTASFGINPFGAAVTGFSYTPSNVCANGSNPLLGTIAGFTAGGTYTASPAGLSINASTGAVNVAASAAGSYTITYTLTATACTPAASSTSPFTITPTSTPATAFSYATSVVCANGTDPALNTIAGFATGGTYTASPPGLSINATTGAVNVAASSAGVYTIQYAVAANGCVLAATSSTPLTITAITNPVTAFSYLPNTVCANGSNPLLNNNANFTGGGIYSASPTGLSINANTGAINVAASTAGVYNIVYTVAASGCRIAGNSNSSFTINATAAPITSFNYNTPVCINSINPVPVKSAGFAAGGIFSAPAGLSVNAVTGVINLSSSIAGNDTVTYTVPAIGCTLAGTGKAAISITNIPPLPVIPVNAVCSRGVATLTATGIGTIKWYADAALSNLLFTGNPYAAVINTDTQFFVTSSVGNCVSNTAVASAVISSKPAKPGLGNDTVICTGDKVILNAGSYNSYLWNDGSTGQSLTASNTGVYSVQVFNSAGCSDTTSISITVLSNCDDIYFPSAFSPNGDGYNDKFGALGNLFVVKNYSLIIYNRYGEAVFSSNNPYQKWDGIFKGSKYGNNTFVWVASYSYRGKIPKVQKGNVVLIR